MAKLDKLYLQLIMNGLILEGARQSFFDNDELVWSVIAQDEYAIDERFMNFYTREALGGVIKCCERLPALIPAEQCVQPSHCSCQSPTALVLDSPPEWEGTPVMCLDCGKSLPLYKMLNGENDRTFGELLHWRKLRLGFVQQFSEGINPQYAYDMLRNGVSELSLKGRRLASQVEEWTGVMTLYPLFNHFDPMPERCPYCGGNWVNRYRDAVPYERFCRQCRLVMQPTGKF